MTFSSTSRLIPLFNLFGLSHSLPLRERARERSSISLLSLSLPRPTRPHYNAVAHPLVCSVPSRSASSARVHPFQPGPPSISLALVSLLSSSSFASPTVFTALERPTPAHLSLGRATTRCCTLSCTIQGGSQGRRIKQTP